MAFCENCGAQLSPSGKFCASCGKPVVKAVEVLFPAPDAAQPGRKSGRFRKFILRTAAILAILVCLGAAAAYYFSHRVVPKTIAAVQDLPVTVADTPPPSTGFDADRIVTSEEGQCALFTKEELTRVLGTTFTHADADATGCTYRGDAPREWVRTEALWKGGRKPVQDKKTAYQQLSHSMPKSNIPIQPYSGVGDEAWVNLWNVVTACKGNSGVTIDLRFYHDSDELTKTTVNTALSRLSERNPEPAAKREPGRREF